MKKTPLLRGSSRRPGLIAVASLLVLGFWSSSTWASIVIDDFNVGLFGPITLTSPGEWWSGSQTGSEILGGRRDVRLEFISGTANVTLDSNSCPGTLDWSVPDKIKSNLQLKYEGTSGGNQNFPQNLSMLDWVVVSFSNTVNTAKTFYWKLTLANGADSRTIETTLRENQLLFDFGSPSLGSTALARRTFLSNVTRIQFDFQSTEGGGEVKIALLNIYGGGESPPPIPEPLTMLGMVLGLGGVGAYIRRCRRA